MLADPEGAGYTLAHEWGHYAYGVYDEYKLQTTDVPVVPFIMNSQWYARGGAYRWLNFSIANTGGGDFQDTLMNNQHRKHEAGAWDTLARLVANAPLTAAQLPLGQRIYYPELAAVAPASNATPRIDLPASGARSALDIQWQSSNIVIQIVIDRSGSMAGAKLNNAKAAAQLLVDQVQVGSSVVGVIVFDSNVSVLYQLTAVTSETVRNSIKSAINGISAGNMTAFYRATDDALTGLLNFQTSNDTKVVFALTDGLNNQAPLTSNAVVSRYQSAQVPLFTFGYGSDADAAGLQYMASATGGRYYYSPTTLADISRAFNDAFVTASAQVGVDEGTASAGPTAQSTYFQVDSTLQVLNVSVSHQGAPSDVSLQLLSPTGSSISPTSTLQSGGETAYFFSVNNPMTGTWQLVSFAVGAPRSINFQIIGVPSELTMVANLFSAAGASISAPEPMILRARLEQGLPIAGANVSGMMKQPDSTVAAVSFHDDGVAPDNLSGDGIYSTLFPYSMAGAYLFTVRFDNSSNTATFVFEGAMLSAPIDETDIPPLPQPVSVGIAFNRSASIQVLVSGVITNRAPVAVCKSITVSNDLGQCSAMVMTSQVDGGSFDPDGDPLTFALTPPPPYLVGTTTVMVTVTDPPGLSSSCQATVVVVDAEQPQIVCPADIVQANDAGQCFAVVGYTVAASDNCSLADLTCEPPSGSVFPKGATTVTCTGTDGAGNSALCSFTVTVEDREAPRVACRPAPNPSAKKIPVAGKNPESGQNPDGYYQLLAEDNCDAAPKIYVKDDAGPFIAGPFSNGDIVKIIQAGNASSKPGTPPIVAQIHLLGDALVYAVDVDGNVSPSVYCKVPPPPK